MKKLIIFAALAALTFPTFADDVDGLFEEEDVTFIAIANEADRAGKILQTLKYCDKPGKDYSKSTLKRSAEINRRKVLFIAKYAETRPSMLDELARKDCKLEQAEIELRASLERDLYNAFSAKNAESRDKALESAKLDFELLKIALSKREALWPKVK